MKGNPQFLRKNSRLLLTLLLACVLLPQAAFGQKDSSDIPTVSNAVAIQGATIVPSPGKKLENATVVFRNGVIESLGTKVTIPYDAQIIDGAGMTVYAGFIDALSNVGVPAPENPTQNGPQPSRSNPTFDQAGISPQLSTRSVLDAANASVDAYRKLGFTTAHTVPQGRMLPGGGAVVLLSGKDADEMILKEDHSMFFQFAGARGVYPGTPMAIMAKFRQLHTEASRRMHLNEMYEQDPVGMTRPPSDAVHTAFFPVIERTKPVFTFTGDALEIYRALTLREELNLNMVLTGLSEGFDAVDKVKDAQVPLALTLGIPAKPEWAKDIAVDSLNQILASFDETTRTATFKDIEAEKRNLEAKQVQSRMNFVEMPARYAQAGLPFSFTSFGTKTDDIAANLREFISEGLSPEDALAALTTTPASLLGLSESMGTVEVGKMANLVVSSGDIFDEKAAVRYVFVNGHKYEYEAAAKKDEAATSRRRRP
jgi:imidazolonepropionase-like amidohydrolase